MIFCIFAMSVFLILALSGSIYRNISDIASEGRDERIALSYIRTKIRNADSAGSVSISSFGGRPALALEEDIGESVFVTYIYLYEGWVHELFHERNPGQGFFSPGDGRPVIRAASLSFYELDSGLIKVSTDYGSLLIYPRSSRERGTS